MQLYIHFGIYKTGSSFIQTICARNRNFLQASGICFPASKYDDKMLAGMITPGNSSGITQILKELDELACKKLVKQWMEEARKINCDRILISDEALIHVFAKRNSLLFLYKVLKESGIKRVFCFAYFRNPVDHCLSTFKHRAKGGTIPDYEGWVTNTYETMRVISSFLNTYKDVDFSWKFNAYRKDGKKVLSIFFNDWLGIKVPEKTVYLSVNPSLSLSEIKYIQIARSVNVRLVPYLYDSFLKIPKSEKANDFLLETRYRSIASRELLKHSDVLEELNSLLPEHEKLSIKTYEHSESLISGIELEFSEKQAHVIFEAFYQSSKWSNIILDNLRIVKRTLFNKAKK